MIIRADLHLHSCVSPCADIFLSPKAIVEGLVKNNIKLAALTDHNSCMNSPAFAIHCRNNGIAALYGMEAQTSEAIHVLVLFNTIQMALDFCAAWYELLPAVKNEDEKIRQLYVDENESIIGEVEKYLLASAPVSFNELETKVHENGGLVIPAHVDRPSYSMLSGPGTIQSGNWDALEFVRTDSAPFLLNDPCAVITSSDAHHENQIGRRFFELDIGENPLLLSDGNVNLETIREAFVKRVIVPVKH